MPAPRKPPPGNPQWIGWLKEWEKEVAERSEHMPKVIRKAIKSFEQCPVPIDHPSNANTLRNVGDKTIAYLTKRLKAFCEENNMPIPQATYTTFEGEAAKINKKKRKAEQGAAEDRNDDPQAGTSAAANVDSDAEINTSPPKKPRKARPYAPRVKTGPWAILIGLASYGTGAWKTQEDIIERADPFFGEDGQSLRDKSNGGGPGSQYYTGWSSSKTLFTKGYLEKKSRNPILYQITYQGWKIARKAVRNAKRNNDIDFDARRVLPNFETEDEDSEEGQSEKENDPVRTAGGGQTSQTSAGKGKARAIDGVHAPSSLPAASQPVKRRTSEIAELAPNDPASPFLFYYLAEDNRRVKRRDDADVTMCPSTFTTLFLIEFRQSQAKHIYAKKNIVGDHEPVYRPGQIGSEGATYSAYLVAKSAPEVCPTFDMLKSQSKSVTANTTHSPKRPSSLQFATHNVRPEQRIASTSSYAPQGPPSTSSLSKEVSTFSQGQTSRSERVPAERGSSPDIVELEEAPPLTMREKMLRAAQARMASSSSSPVKPDVKGKGVATAQPDLLQPAAVPSLRNPLFNARSDIQMTATCDGHFVPDIDAIRCSTWEPGSYTIQLIIDSREKPGLNSRRVEKMLTDKGIAWESATLAMGDAIWIARHKETGNEVVLDASLERKRLDDLLSSMRDGRYMEQKNRMVQSGMSRLIYLVEEYDSKKAMETWGRQIWTMKSSLQVVDNFTVHIAWDVTEVCNYLARLTKSFVEIYRNTTLTVLPDACLDKGYHQQFMKHLQAERPNSTYVYSMGSFATLNRKQHSVHTGWAKMVASINQMSLASTERFLQRWPTPALFFEELEGIIEEDEEKKMQLAEEEALDPHAKKRKKRDDPKIGESWITRETSSFTDDGELVRTIGQALSTNCWKLFTLDKY